MTINQNELAKEFGKNLILNEKLSKYSWFNLWWTCRNIF